MNYIVDHIPKSKEKRPGTKANITTVTIHNTGNPTSTARNERGWLTNPYNNRAASFHIVVDEDEAIECIPLDEVAYHAGNTEGNTTSIGIELCESGNQQRVWRNGVALAAKILHERGWGISRLRTHQSWSGKYCPRLILPKWDEFLSDVEKELIILNGDGVPEWKKEGINYLGDNRLITDSAGWLKKIDEPMPVWAAMIVMANIHRDLKGEK
ncbi:peptidoglycan recognition protein family protein [Alkaliphilus peptidifermentans]|uniref:N-acetylmuramoyl-L-alanine amidase n=1 Tax=Alkaliphilus peptidifermentans DSM 18978 TaxID=1120976 RepID=A0A1G5JY29_9FIRM|nr:N-acetylmuramoyl-L-alanine amidase [Alkaliphilus peptidifermentans]SCY92770.1 N-acetylmuramoyl-L-alanine amidase [Alkaliphilus peptidifermentans DSM 18978]